MDKYMDNESNDLWHELQGEYYLLRIAGRRRAVRLCRQKFLKESCL